MCGVAGAGKTTVGRLVAAHLQAPFADADDFHTPEAVAKMAQGTALTDADRAPWLARLHDVLHAWHASGTGGVLACSALRRAYRERLAEGALPVRFVLLTATEATLHARLTGRAGHFFPTALLGSQRATLEADGIAAITTDGLTPAQTAGAVLAVLG